jgi:hypothetical protein
MSGTNIEKDEHAAVRWQLPPKARRIWLAAGRQAAMLPKARQHASTKLRHIMAYKVRARTIQPLMIWL